MQGELIETLGELSADADRRKILHVGFDAGDRSQLGPQLLNYLVHMRTRRARLQPDEDATLVRVAGNGSAAAAHARHHVIDVLILGNNVGQQSLVLDHRLIGNPLGGFGEDKDRAGVLAREEALGNLDE